LRDTLYGTGLGALVGTVAGALVVIRTHELEHIPFGAAIGTVAGIAGGLIIGLIEGSRIVESPAHRYPGARTWPVFAVVPDGRGGIASSAGLRGNF
jgi:hypothetical protein